MFTYKCELHDTQAGVYYSIESVDNSWKVYEGKSPDDLISVPTISVDFFSDGGSLIAYLEDGRLIYVPHQMFPDAKSSPARVTTWPTRNQQHQAAVEEWNAQLSYIRRDDPNASPGRTFMKMEDLGDEGSKPGYLTPTRLNSAPVEGTVEIMLLQLGDNQYV